MAPPSTHACQPSSGSPVSSSVLRLLSTQLQPPPAPSASCSPASSDASFGAPVEVVGHGQPGHVAVGRVDLVGQAREALGGHVGVHQHAPGLHELARRIRLDDLAVDDDLRGAVGEELLARVRAVRAARAQVELDAAAVAVAPAPFRLGDRVPDRFRRRLDVHAIHLGREAACLGHGRHAFPSSSLLRSASAETRRSVNLSIQRSWISRIGTGLR